MRTLLRLSAVGMMVIFAASLVALYRAPFSWMFRLLMSGFLFLGMYFGWLFLKLPLLTEFPAATSIRRSDALAAFQNPLVRRAIWVLLAAGAVLVATIILGVTGIID
jgi:hypothetical protein